MRLSQIHDILRDDEAAILTIVAAAEGSTPREEGASMTVSRARTFGTIGGGWAETRAIEIAREMLAAKTPTRQERLSLGPEVDQCCGGAMTLAFRRIEPGDALAPGFELWPGGPAFGEPERRIVYVYGAGHVGRAIVRALEPLDMRIVWIDDREGAFADCETSAELRATPLPEAEARTAEPGAYHLVLTHSHATDLEIVAELLSQNVFGFAGLIGSKTKRALFAKRLRERAIDESALARLTCPIGLALIADKRPAVIAASVAAQLIMLEAQDHSVPQLQAASFE